MHHCGRDAAGAHIRSHSVVPTLEVAPTPGPELSTDRRRDVTTDGSPGHDNIVSCAMSALTLSFPCFVFDFNIHEEESQHLLAIIRDRTFQQKSMTNLCFPITFRTLEISRQIVILGVKMKNRTKTSVGE